MKTIKWLIGLVAVVIGLPLCMNAQAVISGESSSVHQAPWEFAASGTFVRSDFQVIPAALATLNPTIVGDGGTVLTTNSLINLSGAELTLQQNYGSWLGIQLDASGGVGNRLVTLPSVDAALGLYSSATAFHFSPKLMAITFGPVFRMNSSHNTTLWVRILGGVGRGDVTPDTTLKAAVRANTPAFSFTDTATAVQAGVGIDHALMGRVHLRLGVDDVHTSLFGANQNNLRASLGLVWRFSGATDFED